MVNRFSKFYKKHTTGTWLAVLGLVVLVLGASTNWFRGWQASALPPGEEPAVYSMKARDGMRNIDLPKDQIHIRFFGVVGNDLSDFGSFDLLVTGHLEDLVTSDFDTASYDNFVIAVTGNVLKAWWVDQDDLNKAGVVEADTTYDHVYYERFFVVSKTIANTLVLYEQPSTSGIVVLNAETFNAVNMTAGLIGKVNATILVQSNHTQNRAAWIAGPNYENELDDMPAIVVRCNDTIALADLSIAGTTKSRVNSTALRFEFTAIMSDPQVFQLKWGDSVTHHVKANQISLQWDSDMLDIAA
jgi:hypothetical protein